MKEMVEVLVTEGRTFIKACTTGLAVITAKHNCVFCEIVSSANL